MEPHDSRGLPIMPTLKISDGKKKVPYTPTTINVTRFQPEKTKTYPKLAIIPHAESIASMIEKSPVSAIDAPTGTGKTRYIPYFMAKRGHKVRVAIPTIVAVKDAYNFQVNNSGLKVGFAAGREYKYNDNDQLVYATTGHFTQRIISLIKSNNLINKDMLIKLLGDVFFIDEVHTATSHTTVLIGLIKYLFPNNDGPRLVFSSATFNNNDIKDHYPEFPIYKVDIPSHKIDEIFLNNVRDPLKDDPNEDIIKIVKSELERWKIENKKFHGIIFRPGYNEVEDTINHLESKFNSNDPIEFYPAYSTLDSSELDKIFQKSDKMKVIIGTNLIESSITIEDTGFVIDDMLEKTAETSSTGGNKLALNVISKAASQQRKGRTGRTIPGRNYKLISLESYNLLPLFKEREIDRIPIFDVILQLMDANLDPINILRINLTRYNQAINFLISFGMIVVDNNKYVVTNIGKFVSSIPLGIQNSFMLYLAFMRFQQQNNLAAERIVLRSIIALACIIECFGPNYFYIPRRGRNESVQEYTIRKDEHISDYHEKFRGKTDIHTFINIFWSMMSDINVAKKYDTRTGHKFTNYVKEWCNHNSMNHKKIKEYLNVMRDVETIIEGKIKNNTSLRSDLPNSSQAEVQARGNMGQFAFSLGRDLPDGGFNMLGNVAVPLFSQAYINNKLIKDGSFYVDKKANIFYKINKSSSFNEIIINSKEGPLDIVVAQTIEVVGNNGKYYLAGIFVPI